MHAVVPPATPEPSDHTCTHDAPVGVERTCSLPTSAPPRTLLHPPPGRSSWPSSVRGFPANLLASPFTPCTDATSATDRTDTTSASGGGGDAAASAPTSPIDALSDLEAMLDGAQGGGMLDDGMLDNGEASVDVWQQMLSRLTDEPLRTPDSERSDGMIGSVIWQPTYESPDPRRPYSGGDDWWSSGMPVPDADGWVRRSSRHTAGSEPRRLGQHDGWGVGAAREWQTDEASPTDPFAPWPIDAALPLDYCDTAACIAPLPLNGASEGMAGADLAARMLEEVASEMARRVEEACQVVDPTARLSCKCSKCGGRKRAPASRCANPCPPQPLEIDSASVQADFLAAQAEEAGVSMHAAHERVNRAAIALADARADLEKAVARVHAIQHLTEQGGAAARLC